MLTKWMYKVMEILHIILKCISSLFQAVCVHCRLGRGRTGVMLACYLVKKHLMYPLAAVHFIREIRPYSVETSEQEQAVCKYSDHLVNNDNSRATERISEYRFAESPPWNFSWIVKNELCGGAWPQYQMNVEFLR